ncbi:methyltransferase domain-containing protein [Paracoccus sp. 11-3]|uniref:Methyltransferase domain-containing protein n=1 Tax=Paracoccus amoyensis TaxID=2760093 RepID=A0A926GML0_9RHOB|nr:class I SAM-dependent methyltransferase [Paracoccus amoyensis]MBC9246665.1 methyltransferase domain-containing protein [Paracoccus amoyensis]
MSGDALKIYQANAERLAQQYELIAPDALYRPVADLLPPVGRMADIGAGSGRDAAWFSAQGYHVTAVEPVAGLREAGLRYHADTRIAWLDDQLPKLLRLRALAPFALVTMAAVWHHVPAAERNAAMASLAAILAPAGRAIMSLRQGPVDPARGLFDADADQAVILAAQYGLSLIGRRTVPSSQSHNQHTDITWTWLVLQRD